MRLKPRRLSAGPAPRACRFFLRTFAAGLVVIGLSACEPSDRTPGLRLSGEVTTFADDWSFTQEYQEIFVEVSTPYFVSHSVTIWCASLNGDLYIGARDPDSKNWPGWVDANPDIRLKIGDRLFDVRAKPLEDEETLVALRGVYAAKYDLPAPTADTPVNTRYWQIVPRP